MILELKKVKRYDVLDETHLLVFMNCEDFCCMLDRHSPNLLVDYLNRQYNAGIAPITKKKEVHHGRIS